MYYRFFPLLFLVVSAYLLWPKTAAEVSLPHRSCYLPSEFMLQWRHSVEHQLWREYYVSDGLKLHLISTHMQTFGAGTPSDGIPLPAEEGFVAQRSQVVLPELNWAVSRNMQGKIQTSHGIWSIAEKVPNYSTVHITATRRPRVLLYLGDCYD